MKAIIDNKNIMITLEWIKKQKTLKEWSKVLWFSTSTLFRFFHKNIKSKSIIWDISIKLWSYLDIDYNLILNIFDLDKQMKNIINFYYENHEHNYIYHEDIRCTICSLCWKILLKK